MSPGGKFDLNGSVQDRSLPVALIVIDVINDLESRTGLHYSHTRVLWPKGWPRRSGAPGRREIPAIYVNDNFGRWQSNLQMTFERCLGEGVRGRTVAELLAAEQDDYFA
jgi:hypothetical protein